MEFLVKHCLTTILNANGSVGLLKSILRSKKGDTFFRVPSQKKEVMGILNEVQEDLQRLCGKVNAFNDLHDGWGIDSRERVDELAQRRNNMRA
jgi:hypothetical protein